MTLKLLIRLTIDHRGLVSSLANGNPACLSIVQPWIPGYVAIPTHVFHIPTCGFFFPHRGIPLPTCAALLGLRPRTGLPNFFFFFKLVQDLDTTHRFYVGTRAEIGFNSITTDPDPLQTMTPPTNLNHETEKTIIQNVNIQL